MAAPIVSDFRVVGVLEVLSWHPRGFTKAHERALDQLVEMIPKIHNQSTQPDRAQSETPIKPEDGSVVAPPSASQSYSIQPGLIDSTSIHAIREALSEQKRQQKREQEDEVPEPVSQPVPGENPETAPASPARLLYRSLIGLSMAVAVTALGYVAGPAVKNWAESPRGAQSSTAVKAVNMAEAASTAPGQTTDLRPVDSSSVDFNLVVGGSANRSPQPKSLPELQKLADAGDADAQWQMGVRYHDGESVPHDDAQAVQWFHRSAEQGNVAAQGALGAYYWRGRGVPADLSKAYFWSTIAMAQGDEMSKSRIEGLSSQLAPAQVSAARQQAEVWIRTHNLRAQFGAN
jgi:hypothetical protein